MTRQNKFYRHLLYLLSINCKWEPGVKFINHLLYFSESFTLNFAHLGRKIKILLWPDYHVIKRSRWKLKTLDRFRFWVFLFLLFLADSFNLFNLNLLVDSLQINWFRDRIVILILLHLNFRVGHLLNIIIFLFFTLNSTLYCWQSFRPKFT